jgi:hypothetical protein
LRIHQKEVSMRKLALPFLGVLLLVATVSVHGRSGFSGTYAVNGNNPGVGAYRGTLTISPRGDTYDVRWSIGNMQYTGVGIGDGDTLAVAYTGGDRSWMGIASYHRRADGSLDGKWAVQGTGRLGTETAVRK